MLLQVVPLPLHIAAHACTVSNKGNTNVYFIHECSLLSFNFEGFRLQCIHDNKHSF